MIVGNATDLVQTIALMLPAMPMQAQHRQ